jgi:hypothetical protein
VSFLRTAQQEVATINPSDFNVVYESIQCLQDTNGQRSFMLDPLGSAYLKRYLMTQDVDALNKAVKIYSEAEQDATSRKDSRLNIYLANHGTSLLHRFKRLGDSNDIHQSVLKLQEAVQLTPDDNLAKLPMLNNLGNSILTRFEQFGDVTDLNNSIANIQNAVQLTPDGHPNKPSQFNNLGNSLLRRFEWLGDITDLNNSLASLQNAVQLTPDGHPDKPPMFNNLGDSLFRRFERLGDLADLNSSIHNKQNAVWLTPDGHPDKLLRFNNLGNSLLSRFERLKEVTDLNNSILSFQTAVSLTPDGHPDKPSRFNNLGNSLLRRFEWLGDVTDLNNSLANSQSAVQLTPDSQPDKPSLFNNLGNSLLRRFEWLGDINDLNNSIVNFQNAVRLTPDGHPNKPALFSNLGNSLLSHFVHLHNLDDIHEALSNFSLAACAPSGSSSTRFAASRQWVMCHHILKSSSLVMLEAYHVAIDLLPQLAWLGSSVPERHHQLIAASDIVCEAAVAAIQSGHNDIAVEWLEQGRSVMWGQLLQLRTPLDFLKSRHPELGQRLEHISLQLEQLEPQQSVAGILPKPFRIHPLEELAKDSHNLAYEREQLLTKIRKQPEFETFMLPKPLSQLTPAAHSGPIIILALSTVYNVCNALILLPNLQDDVLSLTLESFTPDLAKQLSTTLCQMVSPNEIQDISENTNSQLCATPVTKNSKNGFEEILEGLVKRAHDISPDDDIKRLGIELVPAGKPPVAKLSTFEQILAELWAHVTKPVLDALAITVCHFNQE